MGYLDSIAMAKNYHRAYQYDKNMLQSITIKLDDEKKKGQLDNDVLEMNYSDNQRDIQQAFSSKLSSIESRLQEAYKKNDTVEISKLTSERDKILRDEKLALSELERKKNQTAKQYQLSKNPLEAALESKKEYWTNQKEFDKGAWDQAKQAAEDAKKSIFSSRGGVTKESLLG